MTGKQPTAESRKPAAYYVRISPLYCSATGERCGTRIGVAHRNPDCHGLRGSGRIMTIRPEQVDSELLHNMTVCRQCGAACEAPAAVGGGDAA